MEKWWFENSRYDSVRNCPIEIWARIAVHLRPAECKRVGMFLPEIQTALEIGKKMRWAGFLRLADLEIEENIDRGFTKRDNILQNARRVSNYITCVNQSTNDGSLKKELPQEFDEYLGYGILRVKGSNNLGISTFINLPEATNLHLYFKVKIDKCTHQIPRRETNPVISIHSMITREQIYTGHVRISALRKKQTWKESKWIWVPVYAKRDVDSKELLKFDVPEKGLYKIRWTSSRPAAYDGLSWGGCSVVRKE